MARPFQHMEAAMPAYIEFGEAMVMGAPIYARVPRISQELATTTSSAQTTITANSGEIATITAINGPLMVLVGSNPTALAAGGGQHRYVPAGMRIDVGPLKDLDKIAVIDT